MRQLWIVLFFGFFLVFGSIYAFLMARHMGATDRTVDDINWVSPQDCFGCSESDAERFGAGRAAGSDVQMPYHSHSPASATVTVTFTEACDYCSVPIAVTERVALAVEELECLGSAFLELNLVSPRELDVMVAQELIAGFTTTRLTSRVHQKDESWRVALLTDIVPTVLVTDKKSQVVAQWIGFDPGHAPDLFESILQALHCEAGPYAVQEHSAIAAASRGEPIPDWIIRDTSTITAQPAVYIFSDTNCALCVELREATWEAVEPSMRRLQVLSI